MEKNDYQRPENMPIKGYAAEIKEISKEEKTIVAYVSTIVKDSYGEVVLPIFDLQRYQKNPVVLWVHEHFMPPVGKSLWQKADNNGLLAKTQFQSHTQIGSDVWNLYSEGYLKAFSIGYLPKQRVHPGDDEWAALFEEWQFDASAREVHAENELYEYSAVPVPANPDAVANALKDGVIKSDRVKNAFEQRLHAHIEKTVAESDDSAVIKLLKEINRKLDMLADPAQRQFLYSEALSVEHALKQQQNPNSDAKVETSVSDGNGEVSGGGQKSTPEIAVGYEVLKSKIPQLVDGVIREMTGKNL